jgi:superoxide dismutase, Fe-Mn family
MTYVMKPLSCDPNRIRGMSERMIVSHYENNYGGAVKRLNLIDEQLAELDFASAPGFPGQRSEARAAHRNQLDDPPRSVL